MVPKAGTEWTEEEITTLQIMWPDKNILPADIYSAFPRRKPPNVRSKAHSLGIKRGGFANWTKSEIKTLKKLYAEEGLSLAELQAEIPRHSYGSIDSKVRYLGLKRHTEFESKEGWKEAEINELRALYDQGLSYEEMAHEMGIKKQRINSKITRLGLAQRRPQKIPTKEDILLIKEHFPDKAKTLGDIQKILLQQGSGQGFTKKRLYYYAKKHRVWWDRGVKVTPYVKKRIKKQFLEGKTIDEIYGSFKNPISRCHISTVLTDMGLTYQRNHYTGRDYKILRENYGKIGVASLAEMLSRDLDGNAKSRHSIIRVASKLGLSKQAARWSEADDKELVDLFRSNTTKQNLRRKNRSKTARGFSFYAEERIHARTQRAIESRMETLGLKPRPNRVGKKPHILERLYFEGIDLFNSKKYLTKLHQRILQNRRETAHIIFYMTLKKCTNKEIASTIQRVSGRSLSPDYISRAKGSMGITKNFGYRVTTADNIENITRLYQEGVTIEEIADYYKLLPEVIKRALNEAKQHD
jgi:predicted DNA-binding protein YlxM (UPF0122 family)